MRMIKSFQALWLAVAAAAVITAGTAIRESMDIIAAEGARPAGVAIALDRQERGRGERSAIQEVEAEYGIPVAAIARLADLVDFIRLRPDAADHLPNIEAYRRQYGIGINRGSA